MSVSVKAWLPATLLAALLIGCGSGGGGDDKDPANPDDGAGGEVNVTTVENFDASSQTDYAYFSFATGGLVTVADPKTETNWDLAFKRTAFVMNGGDSGAKDVTMAFTGNNAHFYDGSGAPIKEVFNAATPAGELEDLTSVDNESNTTAFSSDVFTPAITGDGSEEGWWLYDHVTHAVSANDDLFFLVRSAAQDNGKYAYAILRARSIVSGTDERNVTLGLRIQKTTESDQISDNTENDEAFQLNTGNNYIRCYHFDTQAQSDCGGSWDIKVAKEGSYYRIRLNGGESGAGSARAFSLGDDHTAYMSDGTPLPADLGTIASPFWLADVMASEFGKYSATYGWGAYSLNDDNKISPNYRVYLAKTGGKTYAFQITSYYHLTNLTSGYITFRYREVE